MAGLLRRIDSLLKEGAIQKFRFKDQGGGSLSERESLRGLHQYNHRTSWGRLQPREMGRCLLASCQHKTLCGGIRLQNLPSRLTRKGKEKQCGHRDLETRKERQQIAAKRGGRWRGDHNGEKPRRQFSNRNCICSWDPLIITRVPTPTRGLGGKKNLKFRAVSTFSN